MTTFSGRSTAIRRGAVSFSSSHTLWSSIAISTVPSVLEMERRLTKSRIAAAGTPRRRSPDRVGMRGSSQPSTRPSRTSWVRRRFDSTVWDRFRRENSYCRGRAGTGRLSISQSYSGR